MFDELIEKFEQRFQTMLNFSMFENQVSTVLNSFNIKMTDKV